MSRNAARNVDTLESAFQESANAMYSTDELPGPSMMGGASSSSQPCSYELEQPMDTGVVPSHKRSQAAACQLCAHCLTHKKTGKDLELNTECLMDCRPGVAPTENLLEAQIDGDRAGVMESKDHAVSTQRGNVPLNAEIRKMLSQQERDEAYYVAEVEKLSDYGSANPESDRLINELQQAASQSIDTNDVQCDAHRIRGFAQFDCELGQVCENFTVNQCVRAGAGKSFAGEYCKFGQGRDEKFACTHLFDQDTKSGMGESRDGEPIWLMDDKCARWENVEDGTIKDRFITPGQCVLGRDASGAPQLSDAETRQQCAQIDGASWQPAQLSYRDSHHISSGSPEDLSMEEVLDAAGAAVDAKDANMRVRDFGSPLYVEVHYNGATSKHWNDRALSCQTGNNGAKMLEDAANSCAEFQKDGEKMCQEWIARSPLSMSYDEVYGSAVNMGRVTLQACDPMVDPMCAM